ncbi:PoNe immunity protein domain-containing protein [Pseudomonas sp. NPDC087346]|uniref:PoNe immunity protein domain-containing protein n=1 Tax=Pseudomonas sp. NPDC087346 TaxID=3364438 RepID=UPI0037FE1CEF
MIRRQKFLTEQRFENFKDNYKEEFVFWSDKLFKADSPEQEKSLRAKNFQTLYLRNILMLYTAGEEIENLESPLETLIESYEDLQEKLANYEQIPNITPLTIDDWVDEYEECVQVISLCIFLHRIDLLKRFVFLIDNAGYAGADTLYEDLLVKVLPEREDVDQWYHDVYTSLIQAIYAEEKSEASQHLDEYCKNWYPSFEQAPWHDTHADGDEGSYVGYWALEAGAIAFLYGIDDSNINHVVYPKDLVEYARSYKPKNSSQISRIIAGQICSKTGFWFTPAQTDSRRHFNQGEIMPKIEASTWGDTIWYWSGEE